LSHFLSFLSFFVRHVKDSYVGLTAKNTRDVDKHCPRRDVLIN